MEKKEDKFLHAPFKRPGKKMEVRIRTSTKKSSNPHLPRILVQDILLMRIQIHFHASILLPALCGSIRGAGAQVGIGADGYFGCGEVCFLADVAGYGLGAGSGEALVVVEGADAVGVAFEDERVDGLGG